MEMGYRDGPRRRGLSGVRLDLRAARRPRRAARDQRPDGLDRRRARAGLSLRDDLGAPDGGQGEATVRLLDVAHLARRLYADPAAAALDRTVRRAGLPHAHHLLDLLAGLHRRREGDLPRPAP